MRMSTVGKTTPFQADFGSTGFLAWRSAADARKATAAAAAGITVAVSAGWRRERLGWWVSTAAAAAAARTA